MKKGSKVPLRIALYGMDDRACKTMEMYLKGPCQGIAVVTGETDADIDMIDADNVRAKEILETRRASTSNRPIILLSLQNLQIENTFFIKKPVNVAQITNVLDRIKATTPSLKVEPSHNIKTTSESPIKVETVVQPTPEKPQKVAMEVYANKPAGVKHIDNLERQKTAKHQSAMQLNEGGFTAFLGTVSTIDFDDPTHWANAHFDPKQYFLGYVLAAIKTAKQQTRVLQLNSIWKSLIVFPNTQEIWLDADDKQLRSFAGMALGAGSSSNMTLTAADTAITVNRAMDKFQDMNAFVWKVAIWTSKGRFPVGIDINQPIFLKRWPNFTRLVITPDAMRIAALLVQSPRTATEVISLLNTKPQYVFVFLSACHTLGLLGQKEPQIVETVATEQTAQITKPKQGLLSKILSKLRGA